MDMTVAISDVHPARRQGRLQLADATDDLLDDLEVLLWLARSGSKALDRRLVEIVRCAPAYRPRTYETHREQLQALRAAYGFYARAVDNCLHTPCRRDLRTVSSLRNSKEEYADLLRVQQTMVGAVLTCSDWQSPAFNSAGPPTAGRRIGRVLEHWDDYKRDRHPEAAAFERKYAAEYVDVAPGANVRALMTACGMAAFTTILEYVTCGSGPRTRVVAGRAMYHECRHLLTRSRVGPRVCWIDESKPATLIQAVERLEPTIIFIDSMCNSRGLAVTDVSALLRHLEESPGRDVFVVIDNTCASIGLHPFSLVSPHSRVRPLVFESLTKYAQFGLDRTAAGVIVARPNDADALDRCREHLGTNIADQCASMVPEPNRAMLGKRLRRIERNAAAIAEHLCELSRRQRGPVTGACYPGLEDHPNYQVAARAGFFGGMLAIDFTEEWDRPEGHELFVRALIAEAQACGAPLAAGASFGFDVTRVYRTATRAALGPFVRIAAGTEDVLALERLRWVLSRALLRLGDGPAPLGRG